jgi:plastocyanin
MLQLGQRGAPVLNLQKNLIQLHVVPLTADGVFGPQTLSAVQAFQAGSGLALDGVVGPATEKALARALVSQAGGSALGPQPWMDWLRSHLGEPEVTGGKPTAFDKEVFSHTSYGDLNGVMEPGCAATACAALEETGYKSTHDAWAASFAHYGAPCELKPGCVVLFQWASGGHHVTFCDHLVGTDKVACLGGNQSHAVKVSIFDRRFIAATRWPVPADRPQAPPAEVASPAPALAVAEGGDGEKSKRAKKEKSPV